MSLHPQAKTFLDDLAAQNGPGWHEMSPDEGRVIFSSLTDLFGSGPEVGNVEDRTVADSVPVRVYSPLGSGPHPALVYFHGGGWVLGDLETHDALCRRFCHEASCVVVNVDYRRSPESVYPAALEDCLQVTKSVFDDAPAFGVDPHRLVIAGDSAGGSLALGVSRRARAEGSPTIRSQLLIYPVVEPTFDTESYQQFAEGYGLRRDTMKWFWDQYLGPSPSTDEFLIPGPSTDLTGLPPTHIVTAGFDVLRDEGEALGSRLQAAQVPTTIQRYDSMIHGFMHFFGLFEVGDQAVSDIADRLREIFGE